MLKLGKSYNNTPKGRSEIPAKPGAYNLRNKSGEIIYTGETENLKRRIKEHHYDKTKHFSSITITSTKTKKQAKNIETRRLRAKKPRLNR